MKRIGIILMFLLIGLYAHSQKEKEEKKTLLQGSKIS